MSRVSEIAWAVATAREDLVLLHGFAGTGRAWEQVRRGAGACTLPTARAGPPRPRRRRRARPISLRGLRRATCSTRRPAAFALAGYSLGGRVALHVALAAPERVTRLVLIATTGGLEDPAARAARRAADDELAGAGRSAPGIDDWVARWTAQPIFAGTPPAAARAAGSRTCAATTPADLADVLRGVGTGAMEPLWDRLGELTMPVDVVVGERDAKFAALGRRLAAALPRARLTVVPGAGHGLPREAPEALAAVLEQPGP